jgi:hypothetical protein
MATNSTTQNPPLQFLKALAENTAFAQEFYQELQSIYSTTESAQDNGQSASVLNQYANTTLNNWLEQQGYNTTAIAIFQTFKSLAQSNLQFWTGIYGSTWITSGSDNQNADFAPVLAIVLDSNKKAVPQLCGIPIKNYSFANQTLSWNAKDGNTTSGKIQFSYTSPINLNAEPPTGYTGPWFKGKITVLSGSNKSKTYQYYGEIADPVSFPLLNWTGFYGVTNYGSQDADQSPTLSIQGTNPENIYVYLAGELINNWTYNCALNKLTWTQTGGNSSTAAIAFYQATPSDSNNNYAGSAFQGTLSLQIAGSDPTPQSFVGILCQSQNLSTFVGCYGMTIIVPLDNPSVTPMLGPQLSVLVNNTVSQVQMDFGNGQTATILVENFDAELNLLRWSDSSPISTAGEIEFGSQTQTTAQSNYIGNYFNGKLYFNEPVNGYPYGGFSYSGEVGQYCYTASSLTVIQVMQQIREQVTSLIIQTYLQELAIKSIKKISSWVKDVFQKLFQSSEDTESQLTTAKALGNKFAEDANEEDAEMTVDPEAEAAGDAIGDASGEIAGDVAIDATEEAAGDETLEILGDVFLGLICF